MVYTVARDFPNADVDMQSLKNGDKNSKKGKVMADERNNQTRHFLIRLIHSVRQDDKQTAQREALLQDDQRPVAITMCSAEDESR